LNFLDLLQKLKRCECANYYHPDLDRERIRFKKSQKFLDLFFESPYISEKSLKTPGKK